MHQTFHSLVPVREMQPGDRVFPDSRTGEALPYLIRATHDTSKPAMTHWYSYTIMQTARSLYHYSSPFAEAGTLLMTNYDALMIEASALPEGIPEKHSLASQMCDMGDLRYQRLTNVRILAPRHVTCDQKDTRPGVPLEGRSA